MENKKKYVKPQIMRNDYARFESVYASFEDGLDVKTYNSGHVTSTDNPKFRLPGMIM